MRRRVVAIGDLHGDVHRLTRILERQEVLSKDGQWKASAHNVDVVLLGDYVDWRGEELEGPKPSWEHGAARLMETLMGLATQVTEMRMARPSFTAAFHPLLGNHDKLMLDSWRYLKRVPGQVKPLAGIYQEHRKVARALTPPRPKTSDAILHQRLINWLMVGGAATIKSFGGLETWMKRMDDGLAAFLEGTVRLGVVINGKQYTHSVPDDPKYWRPLTELEHLPPVEKDLAVEELVWGRKIWGLDYKTGAKLAKPDQAWIEKMLAAFKVKAFVVGHSLVQSLYPVRAYEGKVINIDLHGNPLSEPWLEDYEDEVMSKNRY